MSSAILRERLQEKSQNHNEIEDDELSLYNLSHDFERIDFLRAKKEVSLEKVNSLIKALKFETTELSKIYNRIGTLKEMEEFFSSFRSDEPDDIELISRCNKERLELSELYHQKLDKINDSFEIVLRDAKKQLRNNTLNKIKLKTELNHFDLMSNLKMLREGIKHGDNIYFHRTNSEEIDVFETFKGVHFIESKINKKVQSSLEGFNPAFINETVKYGMDKNDKFLFNIKALTGIYGIDKNTITSSSLKKELGKNDDIIKFEKDEFKKKERTLRELKGKIKVHENEDLKEEKDYLKNEMADLMLSINRNVEKSVLLKAVLDKLSLKRGIEYLK